MAEIRTLKLNLLADVDQFTRGLKGAKGDIDNLGYKIGNFSREAVKYFAIAAAAATAFAVKVGIDSVKAAGDLGESLNKVGVIFGESKKDIIEYSKTAATRLGLSQKAALDAASTFATFGKASGLAGKDLTNFSKTLTNLSADLASFYNSSPEEAITAIGAALRGESEPIRKYGVLLDDATLKARAMEMGLYNGKGALDLQAKSLAAYQEILAQTKDAQGDFANTSESLANQQKTLAAGYEDLKAGIGIALLPVMLQLVQFANQTLIPTLSKIADGFSGKPDSISNKLKQVGKDLGYAPDSGAYNLGKSLRDVADALGSLFREIAGKDAAGAPSTLQKLADSLETLAGAIEWVTRAYSKFADFYGGAKLPKNLSPNFNAPRSGSMALGGSVKAGQAYRVGEFGAEMFVPSSNGRIIPNNQMGSGTTIINLNGIVDGESARRTIERLLQDSARRTGAVNFAGAVL